MDQNARGSTSGSAQSKDGNTTIDPQQRFHEISEAYSRLVSAIDQQKRAAKANSNDTGESSDSADALKKGGSASGTSGSSMKPSGKKKRQQRKHQSNGNSSASTSSTSSPPLSSTLQFPPLPFPPELAAHYLSSAAAAAAAASNGGSGNSGSGSGSAKGRVFGPILPPKMTGDSSDGKGGSANFDFGAFARSCGGINLSDLGMDSSSVDNGGDSSSSQTSYSEAEIKALMSMFVEFMGMFSDQDTSGSGDGPSIPSAISRETIMKMNAALAASSSAAAAAKAAANSSDTSSKSHQADAASSFPVFSMLFGIPRPGFSHEALNVTPEAVAQAWKSELGMDGTSARNSSSSQNKNSNGDWGDYYEEDDDDDDDDDDDESGMDEELSRLLAGETIDGSNDGDSADWVYGSSTKEGPNSSSNTRWIMTNPEGKSDSSTKIFSVSSTRKSSNSKRDNPPQDKARGLTVADQQFLGSKGSRSAVTGSFVGKPLPVIKCYHGRVCGSVSLQKMKDNDHDGNLNATCENHHECCSHDNGDGEQDDENAEIDPDSNNAMDKDDEERAKKAAKKREKKNRRKEKAKREAAIRAEINAQRRREARITSWRSRVATACSNGEVGKLESLLSECPFKNMAKGGTARQHSAENNENSKLNTDDQGEGEASNDFDSCNDDLLQHMEWLLQSCVPKSNFNPTDSERDARQKLALFIMDMCVEVIFQPFRNGRNALHVACQLGDTQFVRSVVEHVNAADSNSPTSIENEKDSNECANDKDSLTLYLDWLCEESGWSPLHYATASGSVELIEILIAGGSNVKILTNPSLTCKVSNGKGASALELAESLHSGKWKSQIVCYGKALEEAVSENVKSFEALISRLVDIEKNGYTPLDPIQSAIGDDHDSYSNDKETATNSKCDSRYSSSDEIDYAKRNAQHDNQQNLRSMESQASIEGSKKKRRNRKKKNQQLQQQQPQSQNPSSQPEVANAKDDEGSQTEAPIQKEEDPLVSALLAMGFTMEQVEAAVKACGGTERATADDLVAWIFENESGTNSSDISEQPKPKPDANTRSPEADMVSLPKAKSANTNTGQHIQRNVASIKAQQMQRISAQAKKEAIEAAEREKEAQAAAQRLAAKREEQRRINREWNNREQVRQREEAQIKVLEEIERRKKAEQDRMKSEVMKGATDRVQPTAVLAESSNATVVSTSSVPGPPRGNTSRSSSFQPHSPLQNNAGHTSQFQVRNQYQSTAQYPGGDSFIALENTFNAISVESNSVHSTSVGSEPKNFSLESSNVSHSDKPKSYHGLMANAPEFNANTVLNANTTSNLPVYVDEYSRQPEVTSKFLKDPQHRSTRVGGKHNSPKLEVNAYDFPELGKEKEQKPQKTRNPRKNNNHHADESTSSSGGSGNKKPGRGKRHNKASKNMNSHTILTNGSISNSTPPPGFRSSGGYIAKQQSNVSSKNTKTESSTYVPAPNATGEIRATARAFVPANFKPPPPSSTPVADKKSSGSVPPPGLDAPLFGSSGSRIPSAPPANSIASSFSTSGMNVFTPSIAASSSKNTDTAALLAPVSSLLSSTPAPISSKNDTASTAPNPSMSTLLASVSSSLLPPAPSPGLSSTSTGTGVPIDDTSLYGSKLVNPSNLQEGAAINSNIWGGGPSTGGFSTLNSFSFADTNQQQQQPRPGNSDEKPAVGNFFLGGTGSGLGSIW